MNVEIQAALNLPDETDAYLQISDIVYDQYSKEGFDQLSEQERTFFCVDTLIRAITNGGITQFLYESGDKQFTSTLSALSVIGAHKASKLLGDLYKHIGNALPEDSESRSDFVDNLEISDELSNVEDRLFAMETELMKLSLQFVGKFRKAFK